ncbi:MULTISPECIES: hypothetical protein [unclassified Sphingomonas]|uniref:hypothetical protein n=1 Tax=unclassified Sphingomonas TaxID=196159 RepID=UPI0006FC8D7C|nr:MULTISPECIES: hypothetical protein [unclassified Sphingomonas]KQM96861.1 hypothetical protein ASE78_13050 [Sphingomonas sp. Leaf25]KQN39643.1 hypothetical protein ASE97_06165 [Sphingomonas sp. Leaf42]KQT28918.1 hypothetical protein ASG37_08875 [Sphingomonas sp. Leaf407]
MAPLVYIMAILGCGDDGAACTRERIAPASYTSVAECRAAMPAMLARNTDLSYPVVSASCERGDAQIVERLPVSPQRSG